MEELRDLISTTEDAPEKIRIIIEKLSQNPRLIYGGVKYSYQNDLIVAAINSKSKLAYTLIDWYRTVEIFTTSFIGEYLYRAMETKNIGVIKHIIASFNFTEIITPREYNVLISEIINIGDLQILELILSFVDRDDTTDAYKIDMNAILADLEITDMMNEKYIQIFKYLIRDKRCEALGILKVYVHAVLDVAKDMRLANKGLSPDFEDLNIKIEETEALCRTLKYFRQKCTPMIGLTSETILYRPDSMQSRLAKLRIFILNKSGTSDWNSINQSDRIILYDELKKDDKLSDYYSILTIDDMARVF